MWMHTHIKSNVFCKLLKGLWVIIKVETHLATLFGACGGGWLASGASALRMVRITVETHGMDLLM